MSKMLEAINVKKVYNDAAQEVSAVRGISLSVQEGESLAIVGPSGAGKSTLLHILGGLDKPSDGRVLFRDQSLYDLKDPQRARLRNQDFGFIFQFYHLLPELNALENVALPKMVMNNASSAKQYEEDAKELLDKVGLSHRFQHKPNQLSGGEQQRVAIARALMNNPKLILCDEPTGNLDSQSGSDVIDLLLKLNDEYQQTLIVVTHDHQIAGRLARKLTVKDGVIEG